MKYQLKDGQFRLTSEQVKKIIDSCECYRDRLIIKILIETGVRREECSKIKVIDFYINAGYLTVLGKGKKTRLIPIDKSLLQEVEFYVKTECGGQNTGYLFKSRENKAKPVTKLIINYVVMNAGKRAGIKNPNPRMINLNPHLFRHTFAHRCKSAGLPWDHLSVIMGHTEVTTTANMYGLPDIEQVSTRFRELRGRILNMA